MQIGGPIAMIFLIVFVLYMMYSVETAQPAERKQEWYAEICAPTAERPTCRILIKPLERAYTPYQCHHYGLVEAIKRLKKYPGWVLMKHGCRKASLSV